MSPETVYIFFDIVIAGYDFCLNTCLVSGDLPDPCETSGVNFKDNLVPADFCRNSCPAMFNSTVVKRKLYIAFFLSYNCFAKPPKIGQIDQYTRMLRKVLCQAHLVMIMDMTLKRTSIRK